MKYFVAIALIAAVASAGIVKPMQVTSPISVGPAILEASPISVGPAFIDFPLPDGGAVTAEGPAIYPIGVIQPSPVVIGEIPAGASPLVQIIVNVNQADSAVVTPAPVIEGIVVPGPVNVVESPDVIVPGQAVDEIFVPGPINIVDGVDVSPVIEPVLVVSPVIIDPIAVGTPIIPAPAVVLPEELN